MTLLTARELGIWAQQEVDAGDPWVQQVIAAASNVVRAAANQPGWTIQTAPPRAREIACHLAARSFVNPTSVTREGIGPISENRVEELASALHLTQAERAELAVMSPDALPGALPGQPQGGVLWVQPLRESTVTSNRDIVISGVDYGHSDDSYAFEPEA